MPVRRDKRTGRWFFRFTATTPKGRRSVYGTPGKVGSPYEHLPRTKKGAEEAERIARANVYAPPKDPEPERPTFGEFVETYYMPRMRTIGSKKLNKPATLSNKESHLRLHLLPRFGERRIDEIGDEDVDDLKLALSTGTPSKPTGLKPKSVNNILGTLHNVLKHARKRKLIAAVPEFEWFGKSEQPFDFLDFEEAERLLSGAAKVEDWTCAIVLASKTGMRLGELRALRWSDVDLVKRQVRISRNLWRKHEGTPKGGRSRTVDLPASAVAALKAHRHLRGERVFLDPNGDDYSIGAWRHGLYRACRRAGLRSIGWHVLRHTVASHLVMRGVAVVAVQQVLGHATLAMTMRYAHLAPGVTRAAVATLDEPAPDFAGGGQQAPAKSSNNDFADNGCSTVAVSDEKSGK